MAQQEVVLSDVHMETCPPMPAGSTWSTRFCYSLPHQHQRDTSNNTQSASPPLLDSDGDMVLPCRPQRKQHSLTLHHSLATPISSCGEQVWPGACLLADWVLAHRQQLQGQVVVELGAGVGLVSLLAGGFAQTVFLTDADLGALLLAQQNVAEAAAAQETGAAADSKADIRVRTLNWLALFDTRLQQLPQTEVLQLLNSSSSSTEESGGSCKEPSTQPGSGGHTQNMQQQQQQQEQLPAQEERQQQQEVQYQWCPSDLEQLSRTTLWLAADVVYDAALTDAFMHTAAALLRWQQAQQQQQQPTAVSDPTAAPTNNDSKSSAIDTAAQPAVLLPPPKLVVALEKRYNFTLRDMDAAAPAFEHFMTYVAATPDSLAALPPHEQQRLCRQQQQQEQQECVAAGDGGSATGHQLFRGERLDVASIPQSLQYDRNTDHLELWELTLLK